MSDADWAVPPTDIACIRKRPAMFIGCTDLFGFTHYLTSALDLLLENGATYVDLQVGTEFKIRSDAYIPVSQNDAGYILPFEVLGSLRSRRFFGPDVAILVALSRTFRFVSSDGQLLTSLAFSSGQRLCFDQAPARDSDVSIELTFAPDDAMFSATEISPTTLRSYCERKSYLYQGVTIRVTTDTDSTAYHSESGARDYFALIASPHTLLHPPIHVIGKRDALRLEAVFAFGRESESEVWSFVNRDQIFEGGTHEVGFLMGISEFTARATNDRIAGVLGLLTIQYPDEDILYEGGRKSRIGNPELVEIVASVVSTGLGTWIAENQKEVEYLSSIESLPFAAEWLWQAG